MLAIARASRSKGCPDGAPRAAHTAIYFLLPAGTFSALRRVRSDEVWHHYDGDPVELHLVDASGAHSVVTLGNDLARGERPQQAVVPAETLQAAVVRGDRHGNEPPRRSPRNVRSRLP